MTRPAGASVVTCHATGKVVKSYPLGLTSHLLTIWLVGWGGYGVETYERNDC